LIEPFGDTSRSEDDIVINVHDTDGAFSQKERHALHALSSKVFKD